MGGEVLIIGEDPGGVLAGATRAAADLLLLSAAVTSLVAMGFRLPVRRRMRAAACKLLRVGLGLASVVLSWFVVHTVFTVRHARLYYHADGRWGGLQPAGVVRGSQASQRCSRRGTR